MEALLELVVPAFDISACGVLAQETGIWLFFQKFSRSEVGIDTCGVEPWRTMQGEEKAMTEDKPSAQGLDTDEFSFEFTDEAVEAAANLGRYVSGALTLAFCSGLDTCPA